MPKLFVVMIWVGFLSLASCGAQSSPQTQKMTAEDLVALIQKFDTKSEARNNSVSFAVNERDLMLVYDSKADRMRILTPIVPRTLASEDVMERMMQANYDAVLDARYAMANDIVWAVFIHPLSSLTKKDFLSAIAQTVTAAETFGSSYTSGAIIFGGGDSNSIHKELLKELEKATGVKKDI